jgi:CheY-like chemotaxis protein
VFAVDRRLLGRLEPVTKRVLIVDPNAHAARLLTDLMKALGAREVVVESTSAGAIKAASGLEPGIIFTERSGPDLDGETLARKLRRSHLPCRRAPIIMVTAEATATTILGARDAGVHEFLRKPFTSADLQRRVENVALKPRPWIEAVEYVGPDRRRFNSGEYTGPAKRRSDRSQAGAEGLADAKDQAMRILASALDQFDRDPMQAVRAIREQASVLKSVALKSASQTPLSLAGALRRRRGCAPQRPRASPSEASRRLAPQSAERARARRHTGRPAPPGSPDRPSGDVP